MVAMNSRANPNTVDYWDSRFESGDWTSHGGPTQTRLFAEQLVPRLRCARDFKGTLLDFGCALGDAIDVFRAAFPVCTLIGLDVSSQAIDTCRRRFGHFAQFIAGDYASVPEVDVITSCAVLEHLDEDRDIVRHLLTKCKYLHVTVPFREPLGTTPEHVNSYDEDYFRKVGSYDFEVFPARGWSQFGWDLITHTYLKNLLRPLVGRRILRRSKLITYHFRGHL